MDCQSSPTQYNFAGGFPSRNTFKKLELLNHFEKVNIRYEGQTLIVE